MQVVRQLRIRLLAEQAHIGQLGELSAGLHRVIADEHDLAVGEAPGQLLDQLHVEPLGDGAEVADDLAARLAAVRPGMGRGRGSVEMLPVAAVAHDQGILAATLHGPVVQPLRGDDQGIGLVHVFMLQVHQSLRHAAKAFVVVHAVVDLQRVGQGPRERHPVGVLQQDGRGLHAPLAQQLGHRGAQLLELGGIGRLEIDGRRTGQMQAHRVQRQVGIDLPDREAGALVGDEIGLDVKNRIARARKLAG